MRYGRHGTAASVAAVFLVAVAVLAGCAKKPLPPAPQPPPPSLLDTIGQHGELRVCSTGDYRPFTYRAPDGSWSGIDIDMARDLATKLGVRLTIVPTTWGAVLGDVTAGRCDLAMGGISVTLDRARRAVFTDPYLIDGKTPITRCAQAGKLANLAAIDRPGVRVVVNPSGTNAAYDKATLKRASIVPYPDNNTIFNEVVQGRADVMITDVSEARWQAAQHPGVLCAVNADHPLTYEPKAYLLPRGDEAFHQFVNQWLRLALGDGTYQRFSKAWAG